MSATLAAMELPRLAPRLSPLTEVPIPLISSPTVLPRAAGTNGINDNYLYVNGRRLAAEDGSKYQTVDFTDPKGEKSGEYLVNESGAVQKNKRNVKDADGYYYCTDSKGHLLHDPLDDKCTEKHQK